LWSTFIPGSLSTDGGSAYNAGNATHDEARDAAERAATGQRLPGATKGIDYQDEAGDWHKEVSHRNDRPETDVTESVWDLEQWF
jgi:hypothetical protein